MFLECGLVAYPYIRTLNNGVYWHKSVLNCIAKFGREVTSACYNNYNQFTYISVLYK